MQVYGHMAHREGTIHLIKKHLETKRRTKYPSWIYGLFTVVFTNLEDKDKIFEGGPYFFAAVGLYMRPWTMNLVPEHETFTSVMVWIRLYSLPLDY